VRWKHLIFIGSDDGNLYGLNRETGQQAWQYRLGGAIVAGATIIDDKLFVGAADRRLHAFTLKLEQGAGDEAP
jgi:outer membrane protein assembly factor BamB